MASQARHEIVDDLAEVQALLVELADAYRAEAAAQNRLIETVKRAARRGERQRAMLDS